MENNDRLFASQALLESYKKTIFLYLNKILKEKKDYELILGQNVYLTEPKEYNYSLIKEGYYSKKEGNYILSNKGKRYLKENKNLIDLYNHQDWNITLKNYEDHLEEGESFKDVALKIFKERRLYFIENKYYTESRYNYRSMYKLFDEEKKHSDALKCILYVVIYDLSGVQLLDYMTKYEEGLIDKKTLTEYCSMSTFDIEIIEDLKKQKKYYKNKILKIIYNNIKLPYNMVDFKFLKTMLKDLNKNENFDYYKYIGLLTEHKKKYLSNL